MGSNPLCPKTERERYMVDSCPICHSRHEWALKADLAEAEQTASRLREALERILAEFDFPGPDERDPVVQIARDALSEEQP